MALRTFVKGSVKVARNFAIALAFAAFSAVGVTAQNTGTVTGLVRDAATLAPLAGAQVSVEGTGVGGLVNNVGRFLLLNVPAGTQTVNVTMIGYGSGSQTVSVTAGGTATLDFELREQALSLEGVVVTGTAGQARRREVGNSIESVSASDIAVAAITDVSNVLQGRAAGVAIAGTDGQVGAGSEIRIRGNSSISQSNRPLIYVDGVRMENSALMSADEGAAGTMAIDGINPNDIDRIEIVKGPAATTLYGTEAAGGVVQIFTKRGAAGAPAWTLTMDGGLSRMGHQGPLVGSDVVPMANAYTESHPDLYPTGDYNVDYMLPEGDIGNANGLRLNDCASGVNLSALYPTIDSYGAEPGCPESGSWFRDATMQRVNLSIRGGGETATYFVSGRYADEQGVVDPQGQDSYNLRANVQFQPFDGLDVSLNNMYTKRNISWIPNGNNASGLFLNVLRGERGYTPDNDDSLVMFNDIFTNQSQWVTSASIGWSPTADFSHRLNFGMDYTYVDFVDFKPYDNYENPLGDRENDTYNDRNMTFDYNGSWRTDVMSGISSSFSWGGQVYEEYSWRLNGFDSDFAGPGDQLLGDGTDQDVNESRLTVRSGGFFLQEQIGFGDRFFLTGGMRWDGFSTFGSGFGLAAYPKLAAAYTISDESFFPEGLLGIDALKLRGAWGKSGRAPGAFDAVKVYEATQADEVVPALIIGNLGNADLGPEVSKELEVGFETSLFEGRASIDFTYFDQTTTDALIGVAEAPSFGTEEATLRNLGETTNKGYEAVLNVTPLRTDNLDWNVNFSYSSTESEITDLGPLQNAGFNMQLGFPIGVEYDGVVTNPTAVGQQEETETAVLGVNFPTQTMAIGTRLTLNQSLTLDLLAESQMGHVRTIGIGWATARRETWPHCYGIQNEYNANGRTNLTPNQVVTCVPGRIDWGAWTQNADFIKLRSAALSYRLPDDLVPGTRSVSIALQGKNLWQSTDYQGLDPEATDRGLDRGEYAFEYYNMAPPRIFILNMTVNF
ncbi:MAG: SusC/RagA family TonB-linked outer membrane protein [Gemmatimonadota bacterium]|nr:SusC/RagA family TonB-linked outer membrane protein [Gemmatimonadota bacterium]MDE3006511.1 SusC/RagA family TonB-linked outer membrane protein [Gemmatimonadota bacterium]MDE3014144.1 SusC/RagA family TonB-linked outer membrane protein [Gemmatimonadota bacterium]